MRSTLLIFTFSITSLIVTGFNFQRGPTFQKTISLSLPKYTVPILASLISALATPGISEAIDLKQYSNPRYHTVVSYPANYEMKTGQISGDRDVIAFTDPSDPDTSASIVFSPIPADYTKLTSFGAGKDTLRQYLLPTGDGVTSEVLNEFVKGETYTLEYIVSAPDAPKRHIQSVFALRSQESVIGLTVQTKEDTWTQNKEILSVVAPSLKVNVGDSK